jgi:L-asparagine transporter-like permease
MTQDNKLATRHILMIALGSAIGTGLFLASGESLLLTGPSILLAYGIGGIIMYIIMRALGEMAYFEPNSGSFSYYAYKYIGKYAGFISGWNYWFNYIIVSMIELTVSAMLLDFWYPNLPHYLTTLILLMIFGCINLYNSRIFAEFEFWFAGIKIVTIIIMLIIAFYLIFYTPEVSILAKNNLDYIIHHKNFFINGYKGFILSFVTVIFSFGGTELIGTMASDSKNPKQIIPISINGIIIRILFFYILTLGVIILLYPVTTINPNISPFVYVFNKINFKNTAEFMNIVATTAALSSFNTSIYGTSRMLKNLAWQQNAPSIMAKTNNNNVPILAVSVSIIAIFIVVLLNYFYPKKLFLYLISIASAAAILNWLFIIVTHTMFRLKTKHLIKEYQLPFFPLTSIVATIFFLIIIYFMLKDNNMRLSVIIIPIWLLLLSLCYMLKKWTNQS